MELNQYQYDWMNSLMVIAAEKDLLSSITNSIVTDRVASSFGQLKTNLLIV